MWKNIGEWIELLLSVLVRKKFAQTQTHTLAMRSIRSTACCCWCAGRPAHTMPARPSSVHFCSPLFALPLAQNGGVGRGRGSGGASRRARFLPALCVLLVVVVVRRPPLPSPRWPVCTVVLCAARRSLCVVSPRAGRPPNSRRFRAGREICPASEVVRAVSHLEGGSLLCKSRTRSIPAPTLSGVAPAAGQCPATATGREQAATSRRSTDGPHIADRIMCAQNHNPALAHKQTDTQTDRQSSICAAHRLATAKAAQNEP